MPSRSRVEPRVSTCLSTVISSLQWRVLLRRTLLARACSSSKRKLNIHASADACCRMPKHSRTTEIPLAHVPTENRTPLRGSFKWQSIVSSALTCFWRAPGRQHENAGHQSALSELSESSRARCRLLRRLPVGVVLALRLDAARRGSRASANSTHATYDPRRRGTARPRLMKLARVHDVSVVDFLTAYFAPSRCSCADRVSAVTTRAGQASYQEAHSKPS